MDEINILNFVCSFVCHVYFQHFKLKIWANYDKTTSSRTPTRINIRYVCNRNAVDGFGKTVGVSRQQKWQGKLWVGESKSTLKPVEDGFLGGGFKICLFPPLPGEMIQFD